MCSTNVNDRRVFNQKIPQRIESKDRLSQQFLWINTVHFHPVEAFHGEMCSISLSERRGKMSSDLEMVTGTGIRLAYEVGVFI